jgi:glycerophosphoryl diester phosphodiesterase
VEIIESFTCGKKAMFSKNEDLLLITYDFIAVVDGVSAKNGRLFEGVTGGRKAADKICETIVLLDKNATAKEAVEKITRGVAELYEENEPKGAAAAGAIIFSKERNEIWSVGDCQCLINGELFTHEKEIDKINSDMRALVLQMAKQEGKTEKELLENDVGREFILPILEKQHLFANKTGVFSYGVFNGEPVPEAHIVIHKVNKGEEVVLASDGSPFLRETLAESERLLKEELENNPLCDGKYRSTKGKAEDNISFDDRTYIRFKV